MDARSDVFSLGVVFYEMFVRKASLPRRHEVVAARKHSAGSPGTPWKTSAQNFRRPSNGSSCDVWKKDQKTGSSQPANFIANWQRLRCRARSRLSSRAVLAVAALVLVIVAGVAGLQVTFALHGRAGLRKKRCRRSPASSIGRDFWQQWLCYGRPSRMFLILQS